MGYIRIKHKIVEEHYAPPMAAEVAPIVTAPAVTEPVRVTPVVEPKPAAPEACSTVTMAVQTTSTVVEATKEVVPVPKAPTDNAQIHSYKLWSDFNDATQKIISASINNPAQVNYLKEKALTTINAIVDYVSMYYGSEAGMAVLARLGAVEFALVDVITAIAEQRDVAPFKAIADVKIVELAELLDSANPVAWPKDALIGAFNQYATLTVEQLSAEMRKDWPAVNDISETIKKLISTVSGVFASGFEGKTPVNF